MDRRKNGGEKSQRKERVREESEWKENQSERKSQKRVAKCCVFQCFLAPEGPLKRRARSGSWAAAKVQQLWREAHFEVKMLKTHHVRTTFGSCDVEKRTRHAAVAWSTFPSQNVKNTARSDHFWTLSRHFSWQAQILHFAKSEPNVIVLRQSRKPWQAWSVCAKMYVAWRTQYKRHLHQICSESRAQISWERLQFGASHYQVC